MHIKYTIIIFVNSNRLLAIKLVLAISAFKRFFGFRTASPTSWFERWKRQKIRPRTAAKLGEQPLKVSWPPLLFWSSSSSLFCLFLFSLIAFYRSWPCTSQVQLHPSAAASPADGCASCLRLHRSGTNRANRQRVTLRSPRAPVGPTAVCSARNDSPRWGIWVRNFSPSFSKCKGR